MFLTGFLVAVWISTAAGQDCAVPGHYCMDDAACCGGCCLGNTCIETYGPCNLVEDQCMRHYCPPGMECYLYQPDCEGCAAVPDCQDRIK